MLFRISKILNEIIREPRVAAVAVTISSLITISSTKQIVNDSPATWRLGICHLLLSTQSRAQSRSLKLLVHRNSLGWQVGK